MAGAIQSRVSGIQYIGNIFPIRQKMPIYWELFAVFTENMKLN